MGVVATGIQEGLPSGSLFTHAVIQPPQAFLPGENGLGGILIFNFSILFMFFARRIRLPTVPLVTGSELKLEKVACLSHLMTVAAWSREQNSRGLPTGLHL